MNAPAILPTAAPRCRLVLSGGIALGAFQAGAFAALEEIGAPLPDWIAATSAGALNAAIIAGNPPGHRAAALRRFWDSVGFVPLPAALFLPILPGKSPAGVWRRAWNEAAVLQTLGLGRPGLFRPAIPGSMEVSSLYELGPLLETLPAFVDFERLNSGEMRLSITATDVLSGQRVVFDTARGVRISPVHLAASGALMPLFAPVEVNGHLLAGGGLISNTPLDLVLDEAGPEESQCIVVELFPRAGPRPRSLSAAVARAGDLAFGNQTWRILEARAREYRLRAAAARLTAELPEAKRQAPDVAGLLALSGAITVAAIGYHAGPDEAGGGKVFDFSRATLADRWEGGARGMREALRRLNRPEAATELAPSLSVHEIAISVHDHTAMHEQPM